MNKSNRKFGKGISFGYRISKSIIEDRLQKLEEKVFKLGRTPTNLSQQMLLLQELGLLDELNKLTLTGVKLSSLLSVLLNADQDNIRKDLSIINQKDSKPKTSMETCKFVFLTFRSISSS